MIVQQITGKGNVIDDDDSNESLSSATQPTKGTFLAHQLTLMEISQLAIKWEILQ